MELKKIRYNNLKSENYLNIYSNSSLTSISPRGEIVIDFFEERYDPFLITEQVFDDSNEVISTNFNRDILEVIIDRERKCSVTIGKHQALALAEWINNNFKDGEDNDDDQE